MTIRPCLRCSTGISSFFDVCPHCGRRKPHDPTATTFRDRVAVAKSMTGIASVAAFVVLTAVVLVLASCGAPKPSDYLMTITVHDDDPPRRGIEQEPGATSASGASASGGPIEVPSDGTAAGNDGAVSVSNSSDTPDTGQTAGVPSIPEPVIIDLPAVAVDEPDGEDG